MSWNGLPIFACLTFFGFVAFGGETRPTSKVHQITQAALRYESEGANDLRGRMLRKAIEMSPNDPAANWISGNVLIDGKWLPIKQAQKQASENKLLKKYADDRKNATTVALQLRLARWCKRVQLNDQATIHYSQLLRS